jgi:hypothetical protein
MGQGEAGRAGFGRRVNSKTVHIAVTEHHIFTLGHFVACSRSDINGFLDIFAASIPLT